MRNDVGPDELHRVVQSFYDDLWNGNQVHLIAALLTPDFRFRGSIGPEVVGHADFAAYIKRLKGAVGNLDCKIRNLSGEAPEVVARMRFTGLHLGEFYGWEPTGKSITWTATAVFTLEGTRIADLWVLGDLEDLLPLLELNAQL